MADLLLTNKNLVINLLEHDSLLQNNEAEELDENDRQAAWEDYEKEKEGLHIREQMNYQNNFTSRKSFNHKNVTYMHFNYFCWCHVFK